MTKEVHPGVGVYSLEHMPIRLFIATMIAQGAVDRWLKEKPDSTDKRAFIQGCYQLADELIKQRNV